MPGSRRERKTETYTTSDWDDGNGDAPPRDPVLALRVLPDGPSFELAALRDEDGEGPRKWMSIGAGPDSDIQLAEERRRRTVSWDHCELCRAANGRVLVRRWQGSKNSTKVNRVRVRDRFVEITPGDVLRVGRVRLLAVSAECADTIKVTADNPADYVRRLVAACGTLERAARRFGKNRSTILRWLRRGGFGL